MLEWKGVQLIDQFLAPMHDRVYLSSFCGLLISLREAVPKLSRKEKFFPVLKSQERWITRRKTDANAETEVRNGAKMEME